MQNSSQIVRKLSPKVKTAGSKVLPYFAAAYDIFRFTPLVDKAIKTSTYATGKVPLPSFVRKGANNIRTLLGSKGVELIPEKIEVSIKHYQHIHNTLAGLDIAANVVLNLGQTAADILSGIPLIGAVFQSGSLVSKFTELGGEGGFSFFKRQVVRRMAELGAPLNQKAYDRTIILDIGSDFVSFIPAVGPALEFIADLYCSVRQIKMVNAAVRSAEVENQSITLRQQ